MTQRSGRPFSKLGNRHFLTFHRRRNFAIMSGILAYGPMNSKENITVQIVTKKKKINKNTLTLSIDVSIGWRNSKYNYECESRVNQTPELYLRIAVFKFGCQPVTTVTSDEFFVRYYLRFGHRPTGTLD